MNKNDEIVTTDLSQFGSQELETAIKLLQEYITSGVTTNVQGLTLNFNMYSGLVFLSDEDLRVYMINPETNKLEEWFTCPECGNEGFERSVTSDGYDFKTYEGYCSHDCAVLND